MKYYVITDFDYFCTKQWLTPEDVEKIKKDYPKYKIITQEEFSNTARICSHCGKVMRQGYCIEQGLEYYCSDSCLYEHYTKEEFEKMYNDGEGDTYYTEF